MISRSDLQKIFSKKTNRIKLILAISFMFLLIILLAYILARKDKYISVPVERNNIIKTIPLVSKVYLKKQTKIGFKITGEIQELLVEEGDYVKEGDLIAIIKNESLIDDLNIAKNNYEMSKNNYEMLNKVYKIHAVSKKDYLETKKDFKNRKAELEKAKLNISYTHITSPVSGKIIALLVNKGQVINTNFINSQDIAIIGDDKKLKIKAEISAIDINRIKINDEITFKLLENNETCKSTINNIDLVPTYVFNNKFSEDVVFYYISADINKDCLNKVKIGMNVIAEIKGNSVINVLTIPFESLNLLNNNQVLVYDKITNKFIPRTIEIGLSDGINVEVKSGLNEEDIIAIKKI